LALVIFTFVTLFGTTHQKMTPNSFIYAIRYS